MDFSELRFPRTIVYEEDDIKSPNSNFIEQDEDADMSFDDLITLCENLNKKNKMYIKTNKNLEKMYGNLKNKDNDLLEKHDRLTQINESFYDIASCSLSLKDLKNENDALRKQVKDFTSTLANQL
jgi:flavodoxin